MKENKKNIFQKLILSEKSPTKLARSFCLGNFLAFSPYLGIQTWLVFPLCWLFKLSPTVSIAALYLISNPLTFVPIVGGEYIFGKYLFNNILKIDLNLYNPVWLDKFLKFLAKYVVDLEKYLGTQICFWCYIIGAHIVAIISSLILYPIVKHIFTKLIEETNNKIIKDEINNSK